MDNWKVGMGFQCVEVDVVVYVVLVGGLEWLVVLRLGYILVLGCEMKVVVFLVGDYLGCKCGYVLVLCYFVVEGLYYGCVGRVGCQVVQFQWVGCQVVQLVRVYWGVYKFEFVVVQYYQWGYGVFVQVFVDYFVMFVCVCEVWLEVVVVQWFWQGGCGVMECQVYQCW